MIRRDNSIGMTISQLASFFMIVTTAVVLHGKGIGEIKSAADAASALEPLVTSFPNAGHYAKLLFTIGSTGWGLLAIQVIAGSISYDKRDNRSWHQGLNTQILHAK